ncbi:probable ATP-dependent RNA helicase kurz isoform X2 [Anopheles bellator]|uniref:probable ATP-dependent RNA helicase kurz isoform X2 n=1 Tax=Anopheles bellator TaxID=139047 RepID=UPI00264A0D00|nr:probable ATP-dependent RNA helicase kurz isoform X2 [Anopheles bellator]
MGKRRFNEKGRRQVETIVDDSETKKIKLDFGPPDEAYGNGDQANALVLPSKKRSTKVKKDTTVVTRILSKKQRKRLEKIVDQKKKKENRSSLIASLVAVQASKEELSGYRKLSDIQTKGLKQHFKEQKHGVTVVEKPRARLGDECGAAKIRSLVGSRRKRLALLRQQEPSAEGDEEMDQPDRNPNIVGLDETSSSGESDELEDAHDSSFGSHTEFANVKEVANNDLNEGSKIEDDDTGDSKELIPPAESCGSKPKAPTDSPTGNRSNVVVQKDRKAATYVHVERKSDIQAARLKLPILAEEQVIMETISENQITILAGETGSGKTTQIPQFLYEAGYGERGLIGITEPRRVAAISMSKRVAHEMNLSTEIVSYLIRYEGNVTERTKIKFMTDGVLLKEIEADFLLSKYSCIILDEAHERSVYTDILMGLLSRIVRLRAKRATSPLRLIIMSATLRVTDFTENKKLFLDIPPVISIDSRQYPVTVHFSKTTPADYLREAFVKTVKIHTRLPEGGILIFLTGQKEVNTMVRKLRKLFPATQSASGSDQIPGEDETHDRDEDDEFDSILRGKRARKKHASKGSRKRKSSVSIPRLPQIDLDAYELPHEDDTEGDLREDDAATDSELEEDEGDDELLGGVGNEGLGISELKRNQPLWVLPLYSMLPPDKQQRIFQAPPEGARLCVVATNVAETSLTIPDIKYVVDSGRQKTKLYDKVTGVTAFVVTFTSKASANQRAGRAGRVAPGHCYRLYSSAVFNDEFVDFAPPEVQQKPVDGLVLQMKCMGIDKVVNFPFPSPPDREQLVGAEQRLLQLEALEEVVTRTTSKGSSHTQVLTRVTELGRTMAAFPVAPRFGKILALSHQHALLPYAICLVAALSVQEVLEEISLTEDDASEGAKRWRQKRKAWAGTGESLLLGDPMILLKSVGAAEHANRNGTLNSFCTANGIRLKAIREIRKLRVQLTNEVNANLRDMNLTVDPDMTPPSVTQTRLLRQLLLIGMADRIARKLPESEVKLKADARRLRHAYNLPLIDEPVFLHGSSVLRKELPEWVCFQEAYEATIPGEGGLGGESKTFIRGITAIEPEWLPKFVPNVCNIMDVQEEPNPPTYNATSDTIECHVRATIGKSSWQLPPSLVEMPRNMLRCKYLLKFLLAGVIFQQLKPLRKSLLSSPDSVLKQYSSAVPRIDAALKVLLANEVYNATRLRDLWNQDPKFFLQEYREFLPIACHDDVAKWWPPKK